GNPTLAAIGKVVQALDATVVKTKLQALLRDCLLKEADLHRFIRESYEVDRRLEPEALMRSLARSTQVFGKMLEKLADTHRVRKKELEYIARLGLIFWGLVEVAVPGSFANLLVRHWISVLYLCEALLIAGGLMVYKPVLSFGLAALATTLLF